MTVIRSLWVTGSVPQSERSLVAGMPARLTLSKLPAWLQPRGGWVGKAVSSVSLTAPSLARCSCPKEVALQPVTARQLCTSSS